VLHIRKFLVKIVNFFKKKPTGFKDFSIETERYVFKIIQFRATPKRLFICLYLLGYMLFNDTCFPEEILRCAQDDNSLRGKERGKEGGFAAFFSLRPLDN
jgi:hypothetical protein